MAPAGTELTRRLPLLLSFEQAMEVMRQDDLSAFLNGVRNGQIPPPIAASGRLMFVRDRILKAMMEVDSATTGPASN